LNKIDQIILLITEAREQLWNIKQLYEESINSEKLNPKLHPKIKNFLENLRSSFEYMAHIIYDEHCSHIPKGRLQFPIPKDTTKVEGALNSSFPNLKTSNFELFEYLLKSQSPVINNEWFRELRDFSNLMKHNELPIQVRNDLIICRITSPNGETTSWETTKAKLENGKIHLTGGGSMSMRAANFEKYRDPLDIDSFGWKVKDLPLEELGSEEVNKISERTKVEYYQAGNFYFDFDLDGKNVYKKLFGYYGRTWRKLNMIYMKIYPEKEKLYKLLFKEN